MSLDDVTIDVLHWTNMKYSLLGVPGNLLWMKAEKLEQAIRSSLFIQKLCSTLFSVSVLGCVLLCFFSFGPYPVTVIHFKCFVLPDVRRTAQHRSMYIPFWRTYIPWRVSIQLTSGFWPSLLGVLAFFVDVALFSFCIQK